MKLDNFLIFGKKSIDPWNRVNCCKVPTLLVVEFCQVQGPKPLHWYPEQDANSHLDLDNVAVWIMSSDAIHGSTVIVFNQQLGLYAILHHSTILDVTARAFQRPLSLALLTPDKPTTSMLRAFKNIADRLLTPLLACNRQLFRRFVTNVISLASDLQSNTVKNYYALFRDSETLSKNTSMKIHGIAMQARKLQSRFKEAYRTLANSEARCCHCGSEESDFIQFIPLFDSTSSVKLLPLSQLAPCAYDEFIDSLKPLYDEYLSEFRHDTGVDNSFGLLFCNNVPVMRKLQASGVEKKAVLEQQVAQTSSASTQQEGRPLCDMASQLDLILAPLMSGDSMAILSSEQRKPTGKDVLQKLALVKPGKRQEEVLWHESQLIKTDEDEDGKNSEKNELVGFTLNRAESLKFSDAHFVSFIDLNNHRLRCRDSIPKLLSQLAKRRHFPNDDCLMAFVVAVVTEVCQMVLMARYIRFDHLSSKFNLSPADQRIIVHLLAELDIVKYGKLKCAVEKSLEKKMTGMKTLSL
ncbi:hypothetical protein QR680_014287 [Steinernema hermaphroditum]|uniref:UDENN FLCN/SMCR8-type domain-containing protein n=1 Tax=Steinernema hermaphroditum TaxID=289476 RepID=A0AA39M3Z4_9BILA|nr:hypothetical protein QR680_014287 [Steinernema hermaphroditum]